jgi:hypothetical protein
MNPYIFTVILISVAIGMFAGHAYTIEQAKQGQYVWCKQ